MAKKSIGYVELEWRCPVCGMRNPGADRVCTGCGAPQPDDVEFETPVDQELVSDEEEVARAKAAPDVHCPFCDARNLADAAICKQCGADLTGASKRETGKVLGAHDTSSAPPQICPACDSENDASALVCKTCGSPLEGRVSSDKVRASTPVPEKTQSGGSCGKILIGLVLLAVIGIIAFIVFGSRTEEAVATVSGTEWVRTIDIEGLVPVEYSAWHDALPPNAELGVCTKEKRRTVQEAVAGALEVCGTPYTVDKGTGYGEVVQDCEYEVYEDKCAYTLLEWREVGQVENRGTDLKPEWPETELTSDQRVGEENAEYRCIFTANDKRYVFPVSSLEEMKLCVQGSRWAVEVNNFGSVVNAEPK